MCVAYSVDSYFLFLNGGGGFDNICLVIRVLVLDSLVWALCYGDSDLACAM